MPPDVFGCVVIYLLEFFGRAENVSSIVKFDIKKFNWKEYSACGMLRMFCQFSIVSSTKIVERTKR